MIFQESDIVLNKGMKGKDILILGLLYVLLIVLGFGIFILLFHTPLFNSLIFFYRGLAFLGVSCGILIFFLFALKRSRVIRIWTTRDSILALVLFFSFSIIFFTHIPVTAERSISIFLLGYMDKNINQSPTKEEITQAFINTYVIKYDAMEKRLQEQLVSGTIEQKNGKYQITQKGMLLMRFYAWIARIFHIDQRLIVQ